MKNFFIAALSVLFFVQISFAQNNADEFNSTFFFQLELGYSLHSLELQDEDSPNINASFDGYGTHDFIKLGVSIKKLVAVYGFSQVSVYSGTWEFCRTDNCSSFDNENLFFDVILGLGTDVFPFRSFDNGLKGLFVGANVGAGLVQNTEKITEDGRLTSKEICIDELALVTRIELGNVWRFGQSAWNFGFEFFVSFSNALGGYSTIVHDDDDAVLSNSLTLGLSFSVIRR